MSSNLIDHLTRYKIDNWKDVCIQLKNQQTSTFNNHNEVKVGPISNLIFVNASS